VIACGWSGSSEWSFSAINGIRFSGEIVYLEYKIVTVKSTLLMLEYPVIERTITAHDVAAYILKRTGRISAMKLQKLVYYSQVWFVTWFEQPLFDERIEAWVNGPVVPALYEKHKGKFTVDCWDGEASKITGDAQVTIDKVIGFYGDKDPQWLSNLAHNERPWQKAREGMDDWERGNQEITLDSILEYYSSIN
jgi:uncharacterized phage-associated protein